MVNIICTIQYNDIQFYSCMSSVISRKVVCEHSYSLLYGAAKEEKRTADADAGICYG